MRTAAAMLIWALATGSAQGAGFGTPQGSLPVYPLLAAVPPGALSPLLSASLFRETSESDALPTYYLGAGIAGARVQIPDAPGATAWKVEPTAACAALEPVAPSKLHSPAVQAVMVQHNPLPMECAAAFEGSCTSRDGKLRITAAFEGKRGTARVRGGFFGSEGYLDRMFYTGVRTLSIEHLPSARVLRLTERLNDTPAYSAPQTAIRYLPELHRLLLLGATQERGIPVGHCVALPATP